MCMTKSTVKTRIMGIDFVNTTMSQFLSDSIEPRLLQEKQTFVVTANPEIVMQSRKDSAYKKAIQSSDYVVPDGIGIIKARSEERRVGKECRSWSAPTTSTE